MIDSFDMFIQCEEFFNEFYYERMLEYEEEQRL